MSSKPSIGDQYVAVYEEVFRQNLEMIERWRLAPEISAEEFNAEMESENARRRREIRDLRAKL